MSEQYDLKNFPEGAPYSRDKAEYRFRYIELILKWKEAFEKQERERLEKAQKQTEVSADELPFKSYERGKLNGYIQAKKEILGK